MDKDYLIKDSDPIAKDKIYLSPEPIQKLPELNEEIYKIPKQDKISFKGKDGEYYPTMADVKVANQQYYEGEQTCHRRGR